MREDKHLNMLTIMLAALALCAVTARAQGPAQFEVQMAGYGEAPQTVKTVLEAEIDDIVIDYRALDTLPPDASPEMVAAAAEGYRLYGAGTPHWGDVRLTLAPGPDTDALFKWYSATSAGQGARKSISIIYRIETGSQSVRFNFFECWPVLWETSDPAAGTTAEKLEVAVGHIELQSDIDGTPKTPSLLSLGITDDNGTVIYDENWDAWSGGESAQLNSALPAKSNLWSPLQGSRAVEEVTLSGRLAGDRGALCQWLNDTLSAKPKPKKKIRLRESPTYQHNFRRHGGQGLGPIFNPIEYSLYDCFITRYVFPRLSVTNTTGNVMESITIKPQRIEMK